MYFIKSYASTNNWTGWKKENLKSDFSEKPYLRYGQAIGHDYLGQNFSLSTNQEIFSPIATPPIEPQNYVFYS